ncbi:MAG: glycosyltransferase family 39 protein [Planctomycetes bacterium]|nr:glycosyltransferase family 39 protein [Planctomycetota bacterium]
MSHGLPYAPEPDGHVPVHVSMLREGSQSTNQGHSDRQYPSALARLTALLPAPDAAPTASSVTDLRTHLDRASRSVLEVRTVVAVVSVLLVPATWWLARELLSAGWSTFASLLSASSMLVLLFSTQARPHAVSTVCVTLVLCAALRFQARGRLRELVVLAACACVAVGTLHSAWACVPVLAWVCVIDRDGRRRPFERRAWILAVALAVAVLAFYGTLLSGTRESSWGIPRVESGTLIFSNHRVNLADFDGRGFLSLARTVVHFEPNLGVLVLLAAGVWIRGRARHEPATAPRGAVGLVLVFVLPYLLAFGLFAKSHERFFLPLVPCAAVFAAWGSMKLTALLGGRWRIAVLVGLALPFTLCARWSWLCSSPDTLELAARRIEELAVRGDTPIFVQASLDLPLARDATSLAHDGARVRNPMRPWTCYQATRLESDRPEPVYPLRDLAAPAKLPYKELVGHPERVLEALGRGLYVIEFPQGAAHASAWELRDALASRGVFVERIEPGDELGGGAHVLGYQLEPRSSPPWTWLRILRASAIGPVVEIRRLTL